VRVRIRTRVRMRVRVRVRVRVGGVGVRVGATEASAVQSTTSMLARPAAENATRSAVHTW
jgi:hypothetical protein